MAITDQVTRTLAELGADAAAVERLYAELRALFDQERAAAGRAEQVKKLRDRWLGRKNGLLSFTNDHWLKPA